VLKDYFTAMDEFSMADDTVLTYRIITKNGDIKVDYYPAPTDQVALMIMAHRGSYFDEGGHGYYARIRAEG
jgi:hypothetical protein